MLRRRRPPPKQIHHQEHQQEEPLPLPPQEQQQPQGSGPACACTPAVGGPRIDDLKGAVVFQRYYHLFERGELDALVRRLPGARIVDSFYDKDNWCCVFERVV